MHYINYYVAIITNGLLSYNICSLTQLILEKNFFRAKVWAKFCFPDEDWTSDESVKTLYKQHRMLCGKHFDDSSFTSSDRKRLNKFAIPTEAQTILVKLRDELYNSPMKTNEIQVSSTHLFLLDML